jgi:hypothetical protein
LKTEKLEKKMGKIPSFPGPIYEGHASQLAPALAELARLEKEAQHVFLQTFCTKSSSVA